MNLYHKAVFLAGKIRKINHFPWVTWDVHQHRVKMDEIFEALPLIQYGDIGLHRDEGYLSNVAIPGCFKHTWIHTDHGIEKPQVVEALAEGVTYRNAVYPMYSDYSIILRPKGVSYLDRRGACRKAKGIVGSRYDADFSFDIEKEMMFYDGEDQSGAIDHLGEATNYMRKFDHAFSCTEVCAYSWWHKREELGIYREMARGKNVILADTFLNNGWKVVWASESVTVDSVAKMGLSEEGVEMIRAFRS